MLTQALNAHDPDEHLRLGRTTGKTAKSILSCSNLKTHYFSILSIEPDNKIEAKIHEPQMNLLQQTNSLSNYYIRKGNFVFNPASYVLFLQDLYKVRNRKYQCITPNKLSQN